MTLIEQINEKITMKEVLESYGVYPKRGRNNYLCFMHNERHPSAGITKNGKYFHCFSCGESLSLIDVVAHFENCDCSTAIKIVDKKFNLGICGPLSEEERIKMWEETQKREIANRKRLRLSAFEKEVLDYIALNIRICEDAEKATHITRGEYRREEWPNADLFFFAIQRLEWLNWLYDKICGNSGADSDYDYIYPLDKKELLKKIYYGEIEI